MTPTETQLMRDHAQRTAEAEADIAILKQGQREAGLWLILAFCLITALAILGLRELERDSYPAPYTEVAP